MGVDVFGYDENRIVKMGADNPATVDDLQFGAARDFFCPATYESILLVFIIVALAFFKCSKKSTKVFRVVGFLACVCGILVLVELSRLIGWYPESRSFGKIVLKYHGYFYIQNSEFVASLLLAVAVLVSWRKRFSLAVIPDKVVKFLLKLWSIV